MEAATQRGGVPRWAWGLPLASAAGAIAAWAGWCHTETGTWLGGLLIAVTGLLVFALMVEAQGHDRGLGPAARRVGVAAVGGICAGGLTFIVAGLVYWARCPPFD